MYWLSIGRNSEYFTINAILPLSIFIFNWVNDTGLIVQGMLFGKHKLFERISLKIVGRFYRWQCILHHILSFILSFLSLHVHRGMDWTSIDSRYIRYLGDLTESLLKRRLGIKDSGNIFAGTRWNARSFHSAILAIPCSSSLFVCSFFILIPPDPKIKIAQAYSCPVSG